MKLEDQVGLDLINYFLPRVLKSAGQKNIEFRGVKLRNEISKNLKNKPFNFFQKAVKRKFAKKVLSILLIIIEQHCLCCELCRQRGAVVRSVVFTTTMIARLMLQLPT